MVQPALWSQSRNRIASSPRSPIPCGPWSEVGWSSTPARRLSAGSFSGYHDAYLSGKSSPTLTSRKDEAAAAATGSLRGRPLTPALAIQRRDEAPEATSRGATPLLGLGEGDEEEARTPAGRRRMVGEKAMITEHLRRSRDTEANW